MLTNKKALMLTSLLIAIGLWLFVMGNVDPEVKAKVTGIKVEMQGENELRDDGLVASLDKPKVISVTIEGKRSQIKRAKDNGIKAYIDVTTCDYGENEAEIYVKIPEKARGVTLVDISNETAVFTVR